MSWLEEVQTRHRELFAATCKFLHTLENRGWRSGGLTSRPQSIASYTVELANNGLSSADVQNFAESVIADLGDHWPKSPELAMMFKAKQAASRRIDDPVTIRPSGSLIVTIQPRGREIPEGWEVIK